MIFSVLPPLSCVVPYMYVSVLGLLSNERSHENVLFFCLFLFQKYRLYLTRLQKEKELTASFGVMKHSDISSKEQTGNHCLQNSVNMQQTNGSCGISGNKTAMQNIDFEIHEGDLKSLVKIPMVDANNGLGGDNPDSQRGRRMNADHSFRKLDSDVKYATTIPEQYMWSAEGSEVQANQERKQPFRPKPGFNPMPLPSLHQNIQFDCVRPTPSFVSKPSNIHNDKLGGSEKKTIFVKSVSHGNMVDLLPVQPQSELTATTSQEVLKPDPSSIVWSTKNQRAADQIFVSDMESAQRSIDLVGGWGLATWEENQQGCLIEADIHRLTQGLQNIESFSYNEAGIISEASSYLYDSLKFDYEMPLEPMEYSVIDQGLFIV